jgi:hypothetical protein
MVQMRGRHGHSGYRVGQQRRHAVTAKPRGETPTEIARDLGPCVYFLRTPDGLVKVGHTGNIAERKRGQTEDGWRSVLAVVPGTLDDERALHHQLTEHRARGREFYHPVPAVLAEVNAIRERAGVPAIEPW